MKRPGVDDHDEIWLLLPWLANGRLPEDLRWRAHRHLTVCAACRDELALQQRLCEALAAPEAVSYAPGPSLARLLQRIDAAAAGQETPSATPSAAPSAPQAEPQATDLPAAAAAHCAEVLPLRARTGRAPRRSGGARLPWAPRAPGLAWAATVLLALGLAGNAAYRAVQPAYRVHSDAPAPASQALLHIAFSRSLTIGEAAQLLHAHRAQVVEGPGSSGIFAVSPEGASSTDSRKLLKQLAQQLAADPRVRWVEPLPDSP